MGLKGVLVYDPKTKEGEGFVWDGEGDPPPLIKPNIKIKKIDFKEAEDKSN